MLWLFGWAYTYSLGAVECRDDDSPENPVNWPTLWVFIMARLYHDWPKLNMASVKNILWQFHKMFFSRLFVCNSVSTAHLTYSRSCYLCMHPWKDYPGLISFLIRLRSLEIKKCSVLAASKNKALSTCSHFQTAVSDPYSNRFLFGSKFLFSMARNTDPAQTLPNVLLRQIS